MRVAIRVNYRPGVSGGVEQYTWGLAAGLSGLDGDDRYEFVGIEALRATISRHLSGPGTFVEAPTPMVQTELMHRFATTKVGRALVDIRGRARRSLDRAVPVAPGVVESSEYDVVHFPSQIGERTRHPTIYQPWDLQHLHHPEFFTRDQLAARAVAYRDGCARAAFVLVASKFVRSDVIDAFGVAPERVAVIPPGAPASLHPAVRIEPDPSAEPFALYPAQVWAHKNHLRLCDAVAILRGRGTPIRVCCPGQPNPQLDAVRRHAVAVGVGDLVDFPGYVSDTELAQLYAAARCLVFPSLFEGFGFPVLEAFEAGLPVACSSTTSLGELASGAALLFDPTNVEAIAEALSTLWSDDATRADLAARGRERASRYTWDGLARSCRALYRSAAGLPLGTTDRDLLAAASLTA